MASRTCKSIRSLYRRSGRGTGGGVAGAAGKRQAEHDDSRAEAGGGDSQRVREERGLRCRGRAFSIQMAGGQPSNFSGSVWGFSYDDN